MAIGEAAAKTLPLGAGVAASYANISTLVLGVPLNVVAAAFLGVLAGLAWLKEDVSRFQVVRIVFGSVVVASAIVGFGVPVAAHLFTKLTISDGQLAPLALIISFFGPRWVPAVNDRIGQWLDKIPFIGKEG